MILWGSIYTILSLQEKRSFREKEIIASCTEQDELCELGWVQQDPWLPGGSFQSWILRVCDLVNDGNQPTKVRPFRVKSHVRLQTNRFCHCLNAAFSVMRWGCHRQKVTQEFQFESSKVPSSTEIVVKGFSGNWPQDAKILICLGIIASKPNSETSKVPSSSMQVNAKILLFDQITSIGYDPNSESSRASSSREIVV